MKEGRTQFPYLLLTQHADVMILISKVSIDRSFHGSAGIYSFWTEKPFEELYQVFSAEKKEFGLVLVDAATYNFAGGELAGVIGHIR